MLSLTHTYEHHKLSIWWCSFIIFIKVLKLEFKKKKKRQTMKIKDIKKLDEEEELASLSRQTDRLVDGGSCWLVH